MSRKLPKAVGRTMGEMRGTGAPGAGDAKIGDKLGDKIADGKAAKDKAASREAESDPVDEVVAPALAPASMAAVPPHRDRAQLIVERYAAYAAAGGLIPIPFAGPVGVGLIVLHMLKKLAEEYGVPFQYDQARPIVASLMAAATPVVAGGLTTAALSRVVPGANLYGVAVFSLTAMTTTRVLGGIFLDHFEQGGSLVDLAA
ncbi:DUF697 domain-containing protein [Bradyrhizobium sp. HKCCYLR20261]|uniref:DUF697 domain-containing protein n=1 Tax=Bradyrhizobium sp. HKCCYLR20261 TaxID=3420760 RepID=UPI003EBCF38E